MPPIQNDNVADQVHIYMHFPEMTKIEFITTNISYASMRPEQPTYQS